MNDLKAPNHEMAEADYIGGMKYKEIAEKYNVTINTVKSWKQRYDWVRSGKKNAHTKIIKNTHTKKNAEKPIADEVKQVIENHDLNDKQRLFCVYYIKSFNATKAYQKAYECSYETALTNGPALLRNPRVKAQVLSMKEGKLNKAMLSPEDIFQKYMDIAFADITDYVTFGVKEVKFSNSEGLEAYEDMSYVNVNESWMVDGTLISEVSQGRSGIKIKLHDKMKAMQWLSEHMDMATTEQKARVNHLKNKEKLDNERFEHEKDIDSKRYW